jgi:hypothetical protein
MKRMRKFELEIPGRLNWRFSDAEKAVHWGTKLMVRTVDLAFLYEIGNSEIRAGVVLQLMKTDEMCPECKCDEGLIRLNGILERFDALSVCRRCERRFRD